MHLVLPFEPPWTIQTTPDQRHVALNGGLVVTYGPLEIVTTDPGHQDIAAGASLRLKSITDHVTQTGWPLKLVDAEVEGPAGTSEARLYAYYTFLAYTAVSIARASTSQTLHARRHELVAVYERGRPDWRGPPICLVEACGAHARHALPDLAAEHHDRGVELGTRGDHAAAAVEWQIAIELAPHRTSSRYNLAQSYYLLGNYDAALATFDAATELEPGDLELARKRIQCLYALGRVALGEAARKRFRESLIHSRDPRETRLSEYVFDQFRADDVFVHAVEPLRSRDVACSPVVVFRAMHGTSHDQPLQIEVLVETSEPARAAGTPFVIGVVSGSRYRMVSAHSVLPPYSQLKEAVVPLLEAAVRAKHKQA